MERESGVLEATVISDGVQENENAAGVSENGGRVSEMRGGRQGAYLPRELAELEKESVFVLVMQSVRHYAAWVATLKEIEIEIY